MVMKKNDNNVEHNIKEVVLAKTEGEAKPPHKRGILGTALAQVRKSGTFNRGYPHDVQCEDAHA